MDVLGVSNQSISRCKATSEQLNHLAEFMKNHAEMASGLCQTLQGRVEFDRTWAKLTAELNALGGPIKTTAKWKQTWRDMRCNVKRKAAHNRSEYRGYGPCSTGNGPSTIITLTPAEEQVLSVLGPVAVYGMEDIMSTEVNPPINITCPMSPGTTKYTASLPTTEMAPLAVPPEPSTSTDPPPAAAPSHRAETPQAEVKHTAASRKRKRITKGVENFDNKLLRLEEEKLLVKKQRLQVETEKLQAKRERTDVLIRLVDVLQDISNKLDK